MQNINQHWLQFNVSSNALTEALGRTANIVGEYAEYLSNQFYGGKLLDVSGSSADLICAAGNLYQVKARKLDSLRASQLGIIRSWDFNYLVVIIFDKNGSILKGLEVPVEIAKKYGVYNKHQNGYVITTTKMFLTDPSNKDISSSLSTINKCSR
jgi:hypothetical protein